MSAGAGGAARFAPPRDLRFGLVAAMTAAFSFIYWSAGRIRPLGTRRVFDPQLYARSSRLSVHRQIRMHHSFDKEHAGVVVSGSDQDFFAYSRQYSKAGVERNLRAGLQPNLTIDHCCAPCLSSDPIGGQRRARGGPSDEPLGGTSTAFPSPLGWRQELKPKRAFRTSIFRASPGRRQARLRVVAQLALSGLRFPRGRLSDPLLGRKRFVKLFPGNFWALPAALRIGRKRRNGRRSSSRGGHFACCEGPRRAGNPFATGRSGRLVWPKLSRVTILLVGPAVPNGGAARISADPGIWV